jgi:hypothetical protein
MNGLMRADGWEATFKTERQGKPFFTHQAVVLWQSEDLGEVVGLVLDNAASGHLRSAESYPNFVGYRESEAHGSPVAATPGWWSVIRLHDEDGPTDRARWVPVVAWIIGPTGWLSAAVTALGEEAGVPDNPITPREDVRFHYDPARTVAGEGPWPWAEAPNGS